MEIPQTLITLLTGLLGVLFGSSFTSYFNLRSARKDLLFKKKLEHFERLSKDLEENFRLHKSAILSLSTMKKSQVSETLENLKTSRKHFLMSSSPLYLNIERMSWVITNFVEVEKSIFSFLEQLAKSKTPSSKERILFNLQEAIEKLKFAQQSAILEMRRELYQ
ncbi:MAG: hypothetical protein AABW79_03210 [Nanoarchaeota archaeon]